ncbi:Fc.00g101250.m01.CDS01 [Cosmosporella sp. VM-42]
MVKKTTSKKPTGSSKDTTTKRAATAHPTSVPTPIANLQSVRDQQRLLDIFADAFNGVLSSAEFSTLLQEIKQALFNRDFAAAFGREDYLEAYAARWSPPRALCYAEVLLGIQKHLDEMLALSEAASVGVFGSVTEDVKDGKNSNDFCAASEATDSSSSNKLEEANQSEGLDASTSTPSRNLRMTSIGGCAAEHLAFASYLHDSSFHGTLTLLDSGPWTSIANLIQNKITSPPPLSKYASAAARASNKALLDSHRLDITFTQQDILSLDGHGLSTVFGSDPVLVTMLFTLNELYTSGGIAKTTKLLKSLGQVLASGSLVLVVDSPGSYSEAVLGKEKKRYPMQWLLDHTLLETETPGYEWEKLESQESVWFRLPEYLSYPIPLENMRYQLHLYRLDKSR